MVVANLLADFKQEFAERLREADHLLADTRIRWVSLYDHLALTAGIAVAMTVELLRRGKSSQDICGVNLPEHELRTLACLCGFLHDIGKVRIGETGYRYHVPRGVEYAREWLEIKEVDDLLRPIVLNGVARHHLRDDPRTPLEKIICLADSYASAGDRPELGKATTAEEFRKIARQTQELEEELFGTEAPVCLLLGDADAIKGYVYETNSLPEIRGGSQILQDLEEKIREKFRQRLAEECLIYCGGGGFLAIVPASDALESKRRIEALYLEQTRTATITIVASDPIGYADVGRGLAPYDDAQVKNLIANGGAADLIFSHFESLLQDRTKRKNFGELVAKLTGELQQAKRSREHAPFFETLPIHKRCESCGKRAAEKLDDKRNEWLCGICEHKRSQGRSERRTFVERFMEWTKTRKNVEIPLKNPQGELRFPADLDTLVGAEGRIALLYADGNNMGDLLQLMPSPASYRHFSQVLDSATKEALFSAFWKVFGEERFKDPKQSLPFEIIALGGDDVVVIVPASYGWALAVQMLEEFEQHAEIKKLEEELDERLKNALRQTVRLSLSAGLAIADVKYHVRFLFDLAEGLLKEAKRLAREVRTGTLCHLWLRAPIISENAKALLDDLYKRENLHLTARPYTKEQAGELTKLARELSALSKSQQKSLAESVEKGVYASLNYALYQAAKMSDKRLIRTFEGLGKLVVASNSTKETLNKFWFWGRENGREEWKTSLADALELIELGAEKHVLEES